MITPPTTVLMNTTRSSRALIVGLALIPLTLVVIASLPALIIMPFTSGGWLRLQAHVTHLAAWTIAILVHSAELARDRG